MMGEGTIYPRAWTARAPVRVDPAGGGTDAPPYSLEHEGAVLNMGIARYCYARVEPLPPGGRGVEIVSEDLGRSCRAESVQDLRIDGDMDLLKAMVRRVHPQWPFRLIVDSDVPPGTGLGSSAAVGVACIGALRHAAAEASEQATRVAANGRSRGEMLMKTALTANSVEREDLELPGGNQDSVGAAFGGINLIEYLPGGVTQRRALSPPAWVMWELERRCVLVHTGAAHLSGSIHADIRASYARPHSPTLDALLRLTEIARKAAGALEAGHIEEFGRLLNENWTQHRRLHPSCDSPVLRRFYEAASALVVGGKTCGAGGGGCILFLTRDGRRRELERLLVGQGGMLIPFTLDMQGLTVWGPTAGSQGKS